VRNKLKKMNDFVCNFYSQDYEADAPELSDWEKYAAEEYEILVAEEGAGQNEDEM
jgi:hypothetical protein